MASKVQVTVYEGDLELGTETSGTPLEIGRQQEGDPSPVELQNLGTSHRLVIAPLSARSIPRQAIQVDSSDDGEIRVTNIHPRLSFYVGTQADPLGPGEVVKSTDEIVVSLPENRTVRISSSLGEEAPSSSEPEIFRTLDGNVESTMENVAPVRLNELFGGQTSEDQGRVAVDLVRSALTVVQKAAGSDEFFDSAVYAVATMVELDRAIVLLREGDDWTIRSSYNANKDTGADGEGTPHRFSRNLTDKVLQTGKTIMYDPHSYMHTADSSMMVLDRAVAAPIFDEANNVIGAIYGDRKFGSGAADTPIGDLEAALLEVMAGAVSSGIARQRQEAIRSNLTQFFSQEIAERLEQDENLLDGKDVEVSVLFCDIRGFSAIAEREGAKRTIDWINDVLTELSLCVTKTNGVLVDYVGDELMAMWGAPDDQPDHASRACRAAVEMLKLINPLRERWKEITPDRFGFGIGINSGLARVGNTGSRVKFKYGPLGNVVNVASRVQGITKKLGVKALITETTARAISDEEFAHRKLAVVQPLGVVETIGLHELKNNADQHWRTMASNYESALNAFESNDLTEAAKHLAMLVHQYPDDNPSVVLLGRVVNALTKREEKVNPIWVMDSK
ncbi:MAG: adenylate/guanylate cyclase domain-containing protein [Rubripirellula sp.]